MIEKMSAAQVTAVYTAWLMISNPPAERPTHVHDVKVFAAGRQWAIEHSFDAVLNVVEYFCWFLALRANESLWDFHVHFRDLLVDEIGDNPEFSAIVGLAKTPDLIGWLRGVADAFVLMGGNLLMDEWKPDRGAMH
jgi:hypothetical protein